MLQVVTYNLYWWCVSDEYGNCPQFAKGKGFAQLYSRLRQNGPFDLIGCQECDNPGPVIWGIAWCFVPRVRACVRSCWTEVGLPGAFNGHWKWSRRTHSTHEFFAWTKNGRTNHCRDEPGFNIRLLHAASRHGSFCGSRLRKGPKSKTIFLLSKFTHRLTKAGDVHEKTAIGSGQNFWYFFGQWSWRQVTMRRWHGISRSSKCWKVLHHTYPDDTFSAPDAENSLLKPSKNRRTYCQTCLPCTLLNGLMAHESKDLWRVGWDQVVIARGCQEHHDVVAIGSSISASTNPWGVVPETECYWKSVCLCLISHCVPIRSCFWTCQMLRLAFQPWLGVWVGRKISWAPDRSSYIIYKYTHTLTLTHTYIYI